MQPLIFNAALLLDRLARLTPAFLYALGAAIAARKALLLPEWAAAETLAPIAAAAWFAAVAVDAGRQLRKPFDREYADAWLDWRNRSGGAVLAGGPGADIRVRPALTLFPLMKSLALPAAFLCAALLLPAMQRPVRASTEFLRARAEAAEELVDERKDALADPDAERFARQIEELKQLAETNPEAAAEALASFEKRLAEAESLRLERAAGALEAAADLLAPGRDGAAPGALRNAMEEAVRGEGGLEALPENLRSAWSEAERNGGGAMTPEQRRQLANALREWSEKLTNSPPGSPENSGNESGAMNGANGAMNGESAAASGSAAARDRLQSASEALDALQSALQQAEAASGGGGESFGAGGVGRGRADAPLLLGSPSRPEDASVTFRPLPKGEGDAPGMTLLRDRQSPPEALPPEEFTAPRRSANDAPATVRAGRAPANLGPARARAVERYFNSATTRATTTRETP